MFDEFVTAENLLDKAGLLNSKLPIPLEPVLEYMAEKGLELRYYNPGEAPEAIKAVASGVDEVLVYRDEGALLFVNQSRRLTRQRFSIFHGIGHFVLPDHRRLNYLTRGCTTMQPWTRKPYERQADRFAAAMNMPPRRFRHHMALLPFGMQTVEKLAERYSASIESAAIHYVNLANEPCSLIWLNREYDESDLLIPDSGLTVRYQVSSPSFPVRIKRGTAVPLESDLFWRCSEEEYLASGVVSGEDLGLKPGTTLWVDCLPANHVGSVIALIHPGNTEPGSVVNSLKPI